MRRFMTFLAAFCLLASLAGGAVVHAAETAGVGEVSEASAWLHSDGDHDQAPADGDNGYPHHHNVCHGHDLAAPAKVAPRQLNVAEGRISRRIAAIVPDSGPPGSPLRPPIA